jgi:hypothetical protein
VSVSIVGEKFGLLVGREGGLPIFHLSTERTIMAKRQQAIELTLEQEAEAQRIEEVVLSAAAEEVHEIARLLASKSNRNLLGETEFEVRDLLNRLGGKALAAALDGRRKKGVPRQ